MKKLLLPLILVLSLASCDKDELTEFKKVDVQQQGELLRLSGYLQHPLTYEFAYSVRVKFCKDKDGKDQYQDFLVTILPGQVNGYRDYVTDETVMCRFISYEIQWQTNLIQ
jgi:hypothetical protein